MRGTYKAIIGTGAAVVVAGAGVGGWALGHRDDNSSSSGSTSASTIQVGVPTIVSAQQLQQYAATHAPFYWAGVRPNTQIELTVTARNATFVRYLPEGAKAGTPTKYLTVSTYDSIDGYDALTSAKKKIASVQRAKSGAVVDVFKATPLSTYFSFPNATFEVEVFSPTAGESKSLTDDGQVGMLGSSS